MRKMFVILFFAGLSFVWASSTFAKDIYVRGYYRSNGTYVRPHVRSSPDSSRANNYGPSRTDSQLMNPRSRDADLDGTPNYLDNDDNNNGIYDDFDSNQYRQ